MKPTTMLYRNLMAMDVEENIRAYPLDAVVLLGGCDKTVPAQLMGAVSVDVPAIMVTGGPAQPARFRGRELGVGTDLWRFAEDVRAAACRRLSTRSSRPRRPSVGHCNEMGTASTMATLVEALGMTLPGAARSRRWTRGATPWPRRRRAGRRARVERPAALARS